MYRNSVLFEKTNARNAKRDYSKRKVEGKCFDCEKLTFYGKTCKGVCDK